MNPLKRRKLYRAGLLSTRKVSQEIPGRKPVKERRPAPKEPAADKAVRRERGFLGRENK